MRPKDGFVYILINPAFLGMVKIGLTKETSEGRAKQLSKATGVPLDYIVVHDELVSDRFAVEKALHDRFKGFRVNPNREFFRIQIKDAVRALQEVSLKYQVPSDKLSYSRSIVQELRAKFGKYMKQDIVSARIFQTDDACFFEITRQPDKLIKDQLIERTDLNFIGDPGEGDLFSPLVSPEHNASIFIETMDVASILNCTPHLLDEELTIALNGMGYDEIDKLVSETK